jgi:hypothetical protein
LVGSGRCFTTAAAACPCRCLLLPGSRLPPAEAHLLWVYPLGDWLRALCMPLVLRCRRSLGCCCLWDALLPPGASRGLLLGCILLVLVSSWSQGFPCWGLARLLRLMLL